MAAAILVVPCFRAEVSRTQAIAFSTGRSADTGFPSLGRTLNFTGGDFSTRLWKLSKTKATVLIPFTLATGTREGCTCKVSRFGVAGCTKNGEDPHPSDPHRIATYRPEFCKSSPSTEMSVPARTCRLITDAGPIR